MNFPYADFSQFFYPRFELQIALYCVLGLKEMSVNPTDNVLSENLCYPIIAVNSESCCVSNGAMKSQMNHKL